MAILREIRRRSRLIVGPILGISLCGYFAFHLVEGDRGLVAWARLSQQVRDARGTLAKAEAERVILERRVQLLRPEHLDRDMLDERARSQLNLVGPNETVVVTPTHQ
ncbi:MAG TPA: septum formation initiator family protein [Stellaceae bacterium]|jgi:cell division protein FtsB|nr:septum formation initiator family protein [Stellaceae bacterium]